LRRKAEKSVMSSEKKFLLLLFFAGLITLAIVLGRSDKVWNHVDHAMSPYVEYDEGDDYSVATSGSVDATINKIHIAWVNGNVSIIYADQNRITWVETFRSGKPTQTNVHSYWMNSNTIFIDYCAMDINALSDNSRQNLVKDLVVKVPKGYKLEEVVARTMNGKIDCQVDAKKIDFPKK